MTRLEIEVMRTLILAARDRMNSIANVEVVEERMTSLDRWNDAVKAANSLIAQNDNTSSGRDLPLFKG